MTSNKIQEKDLLWGKQQETYKFEQIKNKFGDDLKHIKSVYSKYDFENNDVVIEMKARRNNYNTYDTTMIAKDKVLPERMLKGRKQKFVFYFEPEDALYYITYRPKKFKKFQEEYFNRTDRGTIDMKKYYIYIPIEFLKRIN